MNIDQLNKLYPFFILINNELKIQSFGESLGEICSIDVHTLFTSQFYLKNIELDILTFNDLKILEAKPIILWHKKETLSLTGRFEYFQDMDCMFFLSGRPN